MVKIVQQIIFMKKTFSLVLLSTVFLVTASHAQDDKPAKKLIDTAKAVKKPEDKSKRPSPPATATATLASGATVTISYSKPSVKGRVIGKDLEPKEGQVWRTGANEATTFEVSKDVTLEGKALPAGKYSLFTLVKGDEWTIIINKVAEQWGAYKYSDKDDVLRTTVKGSKAPSFAEQLDISISNAGVVSIVWGDAKAAFTVK